MKAKRGSMGGQGRVISKAAKDKAAAEAAAKQDKRKD